MPDLLMCVCMSVLTALCITRISQLSRKRAATAAAAASKIVVNNVKILVLYFYKIPSQKKTAAHVIRQFVSR